VNAEDINNIALIPCAMAGIFAFATAAVFGFGSPWYRSPLGITLFGLMIVSVPVFAIVILRRVFDLYPGYEWVALIGYTLDMVAWIAVFTMILIERRRTPVVTFPIRKDAS
jgi:hypothetical protein